MPLKPAEQELQFNFNHKTSSVKLTAMEAAINALGTFSDSSVSHFKIYISNYVAVFQQQQKYDNVRSLGPRL